MLVLSIVACGEDPVPASYTNDGGSDLAGESDASAIEDSTSDAGSTNASTTAFAWPTDDPSTWNGLARELYAATNVAEHAELRDMVRFGVELPPEVVSWAVWDRFYLPRDLVVRFETCGAIGSSISYADGRATLCYETLAHVSAQDWFDDRAGLFSASEESVADVVHWFLAMQYTELLIHDLRLGASDDATRDSLVREIWVNPRSAGYPMFMVFAHYWLHVGDSDPVVAHAVESYGVSLESLLDAMCVMYSLWPDFVRPDWSEWQIPDTRLDGCEGHFEENVERWAPELEHFER